jgi:hypothetical protein
MSVPKNRLSLKEWQAALDAERAKGLRRGSTLPKPAPRSMEKITTPLSKEPHYTRNQGSLTAEQDSTCFDELRYSQSAGGVFATFSKDGSQYFYPMSRADAQEWFDDDLGRFFNAFIR